jgi:hypothetical protein
MHPARASSIEPGTFFVVQSWADYITVYDKHRCFDGPAAPVYSHHFLKEWIQQHEAKPLDPMQSSQRNDDRSLIFAQSPHAGASEAFASTNL